MSRKHIDIESDTQSEFWIYALPADAECYGRWLLKAAEVNKHLPPFMRENSDFQERLFAQVDLWLANPSHVALALQSALVFCDGQFDVLTHSPALMPGFCALAALGFFRLHDGCAQMTLPEEKFTKDVVRVFMKLPLIDKAQWRTPDKALAQLLAR